MATFVLVHGAWHGGWCWARVTPLLRAAGHDVLTPTLTGSGERVHLAHAGVNLDTHITDVVNVLEYEDLREVILVGHSYGGMVITGVAGRAGARLRALVYLDAFVPDAGQSATSFRTSAGATAGPSAELPPFLPPPAPAGLGISAPADVAFVEGRLTPQPRATFDQPLSLDGQIPDVPRTYILCTDPLYPDAANPRFLPFAERLRGAPGWTSRELPTGHDAMVTMPRELAALLLEAAG